MWRGVFSDGETGLLRVFLTGMGLSEIFPKEVAEDSFVLDTAVALEAEE